MKCYNIDLSYWDELTYNEAQQKLEQQLQNLYKEKYSQDERIILKHTVDFYVKDSKLGLVLRNVQTLLNEIDITNSFVIIESSNPNIINEAKLLKQISIDLTDIEIKPISGKFNHRKLDLHPYSKKEQYQYDSVNPLKISLENISSKEQFLLTESKTFCIYPWIHLHGFPTGEVLPCCMAHMHDGVLGNSKVDTLEEIWNSEQTKKLRLDMLNNRENNACWQCYEKEKTGFFSGRQSANKHHGHLVERVLETEEDGTYRDFKLAYWDIRFSNLCNLKCRSCGHIFSSQWYKDQVKLAGSDWAKNNKPLIYAGRHETDMLEQLLEHIDYVEQIYFAGGEPLVMEEHYIILEELIKRGKTDVRLIYNTNFTQVKLKDKHVFDMWKHFPNVSVGASLDAMGKYAEYIRSGTKWKDVEANRKLMIEMCPHVDFYISATVSIMNALHVTDFHRDWVERGFIQPQDFNFNVLLDPPLYRIDIATPEYKDMIRDNYQRHLEWLKPLDLLNRASVGFESALNMLKNDNTHLLRDFWAKTNQLDQIRGENILDFIPELKTLK